MLATLSRRLILRKGKVGGVSMRSLLCKMATGWARNRGFVIPFIGILSCWNACAELKVVPLRSKMPLLFGGGTRSVEMAFENPTEKPIEVVVRTRVFQVSENVTVPVGTVREWKKLQVAGRQTVIESTPVELPEVKTESRFLLQWMDQDAKPLASIHMFVYPTNVLLELGSFCQKKPLGIFDPADDLKPVLKALRLEFEDLEDRGLAYYDGPLAILGPFLERTQMPETLPKTIQDKVEKGTTIVWIQPATIRGWEPRTRFVHRGTGVAAITEASNASGFSRSAEAQLNLLRLVRLAMKPELLNSMDLHK
jgi:hypothetical protein